MTIIDWKIYLLHQTAKEFLVQDDPEPRSKRNSDHFKWKSSLCAQDPHRVLSNICIWYLLFDEFETYPLIEGQSTSEYLRSHNFLDYSANNWTGHFRVSCINEEAVTASLLKICDANSGRCRTWFYIYWQSIHEGFPEQFTTLMMASYFGLWQLVKTLLKTSRAGLDLEDGRYQRSALSWASENGFDDVVKLLLQENGIPFKYIIESLSLKHYKLDAQEIYCRTALAYAARKGHVTVAERLVKRGARIDTEDINEGTPVSYALYNGNKTLISLLLRKGGHIDSVQNTLQQVLFTAARCGDEATVELLLESNKVDANTKDENGRTPLLSAARKGHKAIVKLLLEDNKVDVNAKDYNRWTPLSWAARKGHEAVVKLLFESGKVDASLEGFHGLE